MLRERRVEVTSPAYLLSGESLQMPTFCRNSRKSKLSNFESNSRHNPLKRDQLFLLNPLVKSEVLGLAPHRPRRQCKSLE